MDDRCRVASIMVQASISSLFRKKNRGVPSILLYIEGRYTWTRMNVNLVEGSKGDVIFFLSKNCTFLRDFEV